MFGGKRRKAVSAGTDAVSSLVKPVDVAIGLPDGFWWDPYVVGFLSATAAIFAKMSTRWQIGGSELGAAVVEIFDNVSGGHGTEIATFGKDCRMSQDPEYARGFRNGEKVISVAYGLGDYSEDPDVQQARQEALQSSIGPLAGSPFVGPGAEVSGALIDRLFYREVQGRLSQR